ncbi:hypothetical protein AKJ09_06822 [Labilithrix luteola]|uniref:Uncharacterized protein n=1 Tax=Labilithrix luteola TaxID=1391654 RepID=A0A0K1Q306_9BACT|nr:hypothetical protein [Labilithrix luteola]AKV00159.1 hypothetical protein AKJ09_06822 [Labilithrix luteola]
MSKEPIRLVHEDPDFARLVDASRLHSPSSKVMDGALRVAARGAAATPPRSWRLLAQRWAVGITVVGTAIFGLVVMQAHSRGQGPELESSVVQTPNTSSVEPRGESPAIVESPENLAAAPPGAAPTEPPVLPARPQATKSVTKQDVRTAADSSPSHPTPSSGTFAEELALVSAARSALEGGDVATCLRTLDRYDERFRAGRFRQEIDVIRIEALANSGDRARAEALANRFLTVNAKSPYAYRVRSLVEHLRN